MLSLYQDNGLYGFKNERGAVIIPAMFSQVYDNDNGTKVFCHLGTKGATLDKQTSDIIWYDEAGDFYGSFAKVRQGDKWGFVNRSGKVVMIWVMMKLGTILAI